MADAVRPKLLFLSQTLPYPLDAGVKVRTYHILELLAARFDITALCFYRDEAGQSGPRAHVEALSRFGRIEAFPIPQEHSRARYLADHLRSVLTRRVYTVAAYESRPFRKRLQQLLSEERFDLVHADSLDLSGYFPAVRPLPIVCVHHDVQSTLLARRAQHETGPLARWYLTLQATWMGREEREWVPAVTLNVAVSPIDANRLHTAAPGAAVMVVPNGADVTTFRPMDGGGGGILFIGGSGWFPNLDGIRHFCETALPELRRLGCQTPVQWVGAVTTAERLEFESRYGIQVMGRVDDIRTALASADCCIVPLRIGGGTRIKILDAWAMGKAVVSTTLGCEGLAAEDGVNLLVRDDPAAFAAAIKALLDDRHLRHRLERGARATAEDHYAWEVLGREMVDRYLALAQRPAHSS